MHFLSFSPHAGQNSILNHCPKPEVGIIRTVHTNRSNHLTGPGLSLLALGTVRALNQHVVPALKEQLEHT